MIKAVIFDFDGTLVDSVWVWKKVDDIFLSKRGLAVPEDLHQSIAGKSFSETAALFKERFGLTETTDAIKEEWLEISNSLYMQNVLLKPHVLETLDWLRKHSILCAIGSSNNRETIENICKQQGILQYFSCIITSCEAGKGKPAPDLFLAIAKKLQIEPSEMLVVDDIVEGIIGGKRAGMFTIGIYDQYYHNETELRNQADCYLTDISDIIPCIEKQKYKI